MPLVSIAMPYYNTPQTILRALASLRIQDCKEWECIIVDDGSVPMLPSDGLLIIDKRIRVIRLSQNKGAGFARQTALDSANGEYLCMLDADDWYYPGKLSKQIEVMESDKKLVAAGCGMAIVGKDNSLAGIRCLPKKNSPKVCVMGGLKKVPIAHAPSIIRMKKAQKCRYDVRLRRSQDSDFLLQVLLGERYAVMDSVLYAYTEHSSYSREKVLAGYRNRAKTYLKYLRRYPAGAAYALAATLTKYYMYSVGFRLGYGQALIEGRSRAPARKHCDDFSVAQTIVETEMLHCQEAIPNVLG